MLGKPTASHPSGGMKQKYHDFADKLWNKFKVVRREIASQTSVIWARLLPGNHLPSGKHMPEIVHQLRLEMFAKWRFEPTSKGSKQIYSEIQMTGPYSAWCPTWFPTWRAMGPAAGLRCSQIFMSECCGYKQICDGEDARPLPDSLAAHYQSQASNVTGVSRAQAFQLRKIEDEKLKEERSATASSNEELKRAVQQSQEKSRALFLDLEFSKEKRKQRADEIDRLKYMIFRANVTEKRVALEEELDAIYATPISSAPSSCSLTSGESKSRSVFDPEHRPSTLSPIQPKRLEAVVSDSIAPNGQVQCSTAFYHPSHFLTNCTKLQIVRNTPKPAAVEVPSVRAKAMNPTAVEVPSANLLAQQAKALALYNDALQVSKVCVCARLCRCTSYKTQHCFIRYALIGRYTGV